MPLNGFPRGVTRQNLSKFDIAVLAVGGGAVRFECCSSCNSGTSVRVHDGGGYTAISRSKEGEKRDIHTDPVVECVSSRQIRKYMSGLNYVLITMKPCTP